MWGLIAGAGVLIFMAWVICAAENISLPDWAKELCSKCNKGKVKWLKGQDSNSTGEAKFWCKNCGHEEYRGGCASELAMETWEAKQ